MGALLTTDGLLALATLSAMEIVLGIDNVVFIAILVARLPAGQREVARRLGLVLALGVRIGLLFTISWMMGLTEPLVTVLGRGVSGRDLILLGGGLFLIGKATREIYEKVEADPHEPGAPGVRAAFWWVLAQILLLDIVFSLDSVITAIGMVDFIPVMVIAIVLAVLVMMFAAKPIGEFVDRHPTIKMLALSFLILVGVALLGEGFGVHVPKGYIYFAMAFSVAVEMLNLRLRRDVRRAAATSASARSLSALERARQPE